MEGTAASADNTKKLMEAIRAGDKAAVDALLKAEPGLLRFTAPNGSSVMLLAAYYGHPELAEVFVRHGAKPDVFEGSALGDLETVRRLVTANAGAVNSFAADGFYPLGLAAFFGHRAIVEFLLKNGANADAKTDDGKTAGDMAAERGHKELAEMLKTAAA